MNRKIEADLENLEKMIMSLSDLREAIEKNNGYLEVGKIVQNFENAYPEFKGIFLIKSKK